MSTYKLLNEFHEQIKLKNFIIAEKIKDELLLEINSLLPKPDNLSKLLIKFCKKTKVNIRDMRSNTHRHAITAPRHVFCYIAVQKGFNYSEIGRVLNKNHSTVWVAFRKVETQKNHHKPYINILQNYEK